jgi:light-regulated signal transduction histidine kinase (bacteriophytochrome)
MSAAGGETAPDLTQCDREPIHIPGSIQPHGALLVLDATSLALVGHAGPVEEVLGVPPASGAERLEALMESSVAATAQSLPATGAMHLGTYGTGESAFHAVAHRSGGHLVVELEAADLQTATAAAALGEAHDLASRLEAAHDVHEACAHAADAIRKLTGFDRVMVYRFLADGSGTVLAEAKADAIPSLLNHHFPASDIPAQARQLYVRNLVRVIPHVGYVPAPIEWADGRGPGEPLDMSDCFLRSVSPIHVQYLKNMDVEASASFSVMAAGELWGLIACHHSRPKPLDFVRRELGRHFAQLLGQQMAARQRSWAQLEGVSLAQRRHELLTTLVGAGPVEESILRRAGELLRVIPSDGVAVIEGSRIAASGSTPGEEALAELLPVLREAASGDILQTHSLSARWPEAAGYAAAASGALYCEVRRAPRLAVVWFRAETVETVNWAGNPHKPVEGEGRALSPRRSFELWRETVRGQARRWSAGEAEAAGRFRTALLELLAQQELTRLNQQLRRSLADKEELLEQKDLLVREVNHRVQNSLQLVNSMLYLQERETASDEARLQFERARQRLTAVAMVHRRLWRTDKIGDVRLETFLAELVEELVKVWGDDWRRSIAVAAAPVTLSTDQAIIVGLIVTELMTNAVKYAYEGAPGPISIEASEDGRGGLAVSVSDRGRGLDPEGIDKSFGSRLIETLVRQLRGELAMRDNKPGLRASLTFPI